MAIKYEISAKTGTYQKDGVEKARYCKMGVVMETKNGGLMMKVEQIPVNWDGFAYLNTPYEKKDGDTQGGNNSAPSDSGVQSDDIPF